MDLDALRTTVDETLSPEWRQRFGADAWEAAKALIGELPPEQRRPAAGCFDRGRLTAGSEAAGRRWSAG